MALPSTLRSRNSCSMAEFRVECLTYAHSRARPAPFPTSPSYGLPPTATIPARMLINSKRPSRLEPADFRNRDVSSHHTESNALPTELPGPAIHPIMARPCCLRSSLFTKMQLLPCDLTKCHARQREVSGKFMPSFSHPVTTDCHATLIT